MMFVSIKFSYSGSLTVEANEKRKRDRSLEELLEISYGLLRWSVCPLHRGNQVYQRSREMVISVLLVR